MSKEFRPNVLITNDNTILALNYVESFGPAQTSEDMVVDILKDDITINVVMSSGKEYSISVRYQIETFKTQGLPSTVEEAHSAILEKWIRLLG